MRKETIFFLTALVLGGIVTANCVFASGSGVYIPTDTGLPAGDIKGVLSNLMNWLLGIFGILAVISFVISGIQYIIAAGDETGMQTAKRNMLYSTMGVIIALSGLIIVKAIDTALRATTSVF